MGKKITKGKELTLKIDGKKITAQKFQKAVNSFLGLLRNVADEITGEVNSVTWIVSAKKGSQIISATPETNRLPIEILNSVPEAVSSGFTELESGEFRPKGFSDTTLRHAKELSSIIGNTDGDVSSVLLNFGEVSNPITVSTASNVGNILGAKRSEEGSVEGRVSVLNDKTESGLIIEVIDVLTGHSVKCVPRNVPEKELINAFRRRIVATGLVHYRRDKVPVRIDVDTIRVLGGRSDLPGFDDIIGIFQRGD